MYPQPKPALVLVLQENSSFFLATGNQRRSGDVDEIHA
jgi:hypothetical protein